MSVVYQKLLRVGGGKKRDKEWQRLYLRLPSEWAERNRLRGGDWVQVEEGKDGELRISVAGGGRD